MLIFSTHYIMTLLLLQFRPSVDASQLYSLSSQYKLSTCSYSFHCMAVIIQLFVAKICVVGIKGSP